MSLDTVMVRLANVETAVYTELLCAISPYFRKAFKGPFEEAQKRSISLDDVDEHTFRMFL